MAKKVIVVGGGLGGLSAAIRLAKMGYDVHLYEQNPDLGGKMGKHILGKFTFDTGPTLITMPFVIEELFKFAGFEVSDFMDLVPVEPVCRYFFKNSDPFDASADLPTMTRNLQTHFPEDVSNYTKFMKYARNIYEQTAPVFIFSPIHEWKKLLTPQHLTRLLTLYQIDPFRTVHQAVSRYFKSPRLIQIFDRYPTYNGSNPFQAPATLNVIPWVELGLGGFTIRGGLYKLIESLGTIAGRLSINLDQGQRIEKILHNHKRASGVLVNGEIVKADAVLCNGDVVVSHEQLIDGMESAKKRLGTLEPSLSGLIFFWGIQGQFPQLKQHNIFFSQQYQKEFNQIFKELVPPDDPTIYISISCKTDPGHAPEGCENWFVLVNMPYLTDKHSYSDKEIQKIRGTLLEKLKANGLDVKNSIIAESVLTPEDIANRYSSNRGSIYGISSNNRNSAFKRPPNRSREINGLYFAGGSTHPGGGVPMCLLSGKIAAELLNEYEGN